MARNARNVMTVVKAYIFPGDSPIVKLVWSGSETSTLWRGCMLAKGVLKFSEVNCAPQVWTKGRYLVASILKI